MAAQTGKSAAGVPASPNPREPSTPPPSPSALLNSSLALTRAGPLLNFFLSTYRIPPFLLPIYLAAAQRYGVPWQVLAAINEVESDYGFDMGPSSAGAEGWMQFLPEEWLLYGVDANGAGDRDPDNPADAIFATARYLATAGAAQNLKGAIYAYNHSSSYVESVMLRSQLIATTPQSLISGLTAVVNGRFPVEGAGPHTATPVWDDSPQPVAAHSPGAGHSSPEQAPAPPPQLAAAASTSTPGPTVAGASVAASPGSSVVAVQSAEVIQSGHNATLGHFIELRDAYGDIYTYARLGRVLKSYALQQGRDREKVGGTSRPARLAPLRRGAWVAAGTVLGNVPGGAPGTRVQLLFEIRPAGAGRIDPRPLLQSWQLLSETQGLPQQGTQPLFGPDAGDAVISEIELLDEHQLQAHVLSDPQLHLSACERQEIGAGLIDRRVLSTLDFLLASGLDPTTSTLECVQHGEATAAQVSAGAPEDAVTLTALNGVRISGHDGPGSLAELAVHRLLALPAAMRPKRVVEPSGLQPAMGAVRSSSSDSVEVDFAPPVPARAVHAPAAEKQTPAVSPSGAASAAAVAGTAAPPSSEQLEPELGTAQWRRLIARISKLSEPRVPRTPTSAAVPDNQSSPLPTAASLPGASQLPPPAPSPATTAQTNTASKQPAPGPAESGLATRALAAPLTTPLLLGPEEVILETEDPPTTDSVLKEEVTLKAVTGEPSDLIQSVQFEIAPSESTNWEEIPPEELTSTVFKTTTKADGPYNLRVVVTDTAGGEHVAELPDRLIANTSPVVTLKNPGTNLRETVTLNAEVPPAALREELITSLIFEVAPTFEPTAAGAWTELGKVALTPQSKPGVAITLNAKEVLPNHGNGDFDFRVVPAGAETYASIPVRKRLVDNTPPTVSLSNPGPLKGQVTLDASAADPEPGSGKTGSGVASVRFQARSRLGTSGWRNIGSATLPSQPGGSTYTHSLNTESLPNGSYDLRAIAEDVAGNEATSPLIEGVEVDNPSVAPPTSASIAGVVAPAQDIGFLGAVQGGSEHEAWAYGFTSAPPAEVDGKPLPYEAEGEQLVLLRYTDKGGWQIADVPREPDGEAYKLLPADKLADTPGGEHFTNVVKVSGAMTPSGEGWLWVAEDSTEKGQSKVGLFHRAPGGQFVYNSEATGTLHQLLGSSAGTPGLLEEAPQPVEPVSLRLGESEGQVYGTLTAPPKEQKAEAIPNSALQGKLKYGLLQGHTWTVQTATPPPALSSAKGPITLKLGDVQGPGKLWAAFEVEGGQPGQGLVLGHYTESKSQEKWEFPKTGLDALELSGAVGEESAGKATITPVALKASDDAVWIEATVDVTAGKETGKVVARYEGEGTNGHITNSWCSLPGKNECQEPLDPNETTVPDAIFNTEGGEVALALNRNGFVDVFAHDQWSSVVAPGYGPVTTGADDVFSSPNEGWLGGAEAIGHWSTEGTTNSLSSWPLPNRSPLTSAALPAGSQGEVGESGAVAVGLNGTTLSYDAGAGWLVQPVPSRARHVSLLGVAFAGASSAFAVGGSGVILHWNGTSWSEDPQSVSLTHSQLNAVAFGPSGEGWAVGANGTILHYDGESWSIEQPPESDSGVDITSVAVAGSEVFAVADGNLITRASDGNWQEVEASQLPNQPALTPGNLRLVSGLPDGGLVAAGRSVVLVREAGQAFRYSAQPLQGIAVALAPFREAGGRLRAYVSVAPPASGHNDVAGFPPGDGELLRQTEGGWEDLSRAQYAGGAIRGDGAVKSDPVLALATSADGEHAWAVGGYDGTEDAAERGTEEAPVSRSVAWQTASIWHYDTNGSAQPPELTPTKPSLPAKQGTVSFAFFTSPMCREECASVQNAQPDVNLTSAAKQIASYAGESGGPAFAMLGGNAVGPLEESAYLQGNGAADFAHLPELLAPLGGVPTFAALGSFDSVPGRADQTQPWAEAFGDAPPPFGSGPAAPGITPVSSGAPTGEAHRFYAFDATQNGGTVRVIVLDNAAGSLEASAPGQTAWLREQLANAQGASTPVVVVTALPLRKLKASDGEDIASLLAGEGVVAVFTTDGEAPGNPNASSVHELDERHLIPENPAPGVAQIPEYEGASLGYQQSENNGVVWYFASIDTNPGERAAQVEAVPVIESLSLKPVDGLSVARSLTLQFEAVGRRPAGTLATRAGEGTPFQGFDSYVEIPAPPCSNSRPCVQPSYAFTSSEPTIGDFVEPSAPGSPFPKLNSSGHPISSSTSGLFCAYNSGTTTVSITAGLLNYSQVVTVQPGGFGSPCGTVFRPGVAPVIVVHSSRTQRKPNGAAAPPPPPPAALAAVSPSFSSLPPPPVVQPPPPAVPAKPVAPPAPAPVTPEPPLPPPPLEQASPIPTIVPPATPPVEPIPPGGAAQAPSTAKREEKARKHASQSAFTTRPAGVTGEQWLTGGEQWFYGAVGVFTVLALLLTARGLPLAPRPRPVMLQNRPTDKARTRRGR